MGKRTILEANRDDTQPPRQLKRPRIHASNNPAPSKPSAVGDEITTVSQLERALLFDQSSTSDLRAGLSLFKRFLDSILYSTEEHGLPRKLAVLRDYLDTQITLDTRVKGDQFLQDLIYAWDFAAETNCEPILCQLPAALALLFKVFASQKDLNDYGSLLARTILRPATVRRFVRNTSAATNKESIIAPALRLLTELTTFNEGSHAKAVYAKREFTLEPKILGRNILLRKDQSISDHVKKPSIRTTSIRYLLAHLKYQDEDIKSEILSHSNLIRAIFDHLRTDPPFLILEILDVFKNHVFQDKAIARRVKSGILGGKVLSRIASLYSYEVRENWVMEGQEEPDKAAHRFLRLVCTDPAYGVMLPTNGFYPSTHRDEDGMQEAAGDTPYDLNLEIVEARGISSKVRNVILSEFIQIQRPYANILHQELIIDIFRACPELVEDYFNKRRDFSYDPKLTATWIGYSSFLFQTIQLPIPKFFGAKNNFCRYPPPVSTMIQAIYPRPLDQQVLSRCLNQSSGLVQLFTVRLLIAILQKLCQMVKELKCAQTGKESKYWSLAARCLVAEISRFCPPIRTIYLVLKKPGLEDVRRESITRLLRLYHEIIPQVALKEKFDVSSPVCNVLIEAEKPSTSSKIRVLRIMELEHWVQMASVSPAMRWWQKQSKIPTESIALFFTDLKENMHHLPFVTLLRLLVVSSENGVYAGIRSLLSNVLKDQDMLQMRTSPDSLDALIASLKASSASCTPSDGVLDFLDDCCARFVKAPIKYFDDLSLISARCAQPARSVGPLSALLMTFIEQWPFKMGEVTTSSTVDALVQWLSRFLYLLKLIGEDEMMLGQVRDVLVEATKSMHKEVLQDAFLWKMGKERAKGALKLATGADFGCSERSTISPVPLLESSQSKNTEIEIGFEGPPVEDDKHPGLTRWRKKELSEAIEDGDIGELLLCLCSEHTEIRLQAMTGVRQLMNIIGGLGGSKLTKTDAAQTGQSNQVGLDGQQIYLLLGEVLESVSPDGSEAFPYVGGSLAARCIRILADPTSSLFSTVNSFLTISPYWNVDFLIRYYWHHIVASDPDDANTYHRHVEWFLDYLLDALRTRADMDIFRKSNIFEQLLGHYSSRSCAIGAKDQIVRLLLRATHVGGSTTLVTRCGLIPWIQTGLASHDTRRGVLKTLAVRAYETCDQEKIEAWSSGMMGEAIARIAGGES